MTSGSGHGCGLRLPFECSKHGRGLRLSFGDVTSRSIV